MQLSGPRPCMGVRFGLLLALWRWVQSSRTCCGVRWLSFRSSATSGRASRLTSSSGSLLSGHGLIHGGPFLLGFMRRLSVLPDDSLHLHILRDNIADVKGPLPCANWARGIEVKFAALGMASPFVSSGIGALDSHGFMTDWLGPGNGPGMACMCPLGQLLPRGQSYAHIIIGLAVPTRFTVNLIMSCL